MSHSYWHRGVGDIGDAEDLDDLGDLLALPRQHVGQAELPDDLFRLNALLRHALPPSGNESVATLCLDQFPEGWSALSETPRLREG